MLDHGSNLDSGRKVDDARRARRRRTAVTACVCLGIVATLAVLLKAAVDRVRDASTRLVST